MILTGSEGPRSPQQAELGVPVPAGLVFPASLTPLLCGEEGHSRIAHPSELHPTLLPEISAGHPEGLWSDGWTNGHIN